MPAWETVSNKSQTPFHPLATTIKRSRSEVVHNPATNEPPDPRACAMAQVALKTTAVVIWFGALRDNDPANIQIYNE
jgi:hypothetical protein